MTKMPQEVIALRDRMDDVDRQLLAVLAERLDVSRQIGYAKAKHGWPLHDAARETALLAECAEKGEKLGLPERFVVEVLKGVLCSSRREVEADLARRERSSMAY